MSGGRSEVFDGGIETEFGGRFDDGIGGAEGIWFEIVFSEGIIHGSVAKASCRFGFGGIWEI